MYAVVCDHTTGCEAYSFATDGYGSGQIWVCVMTDGYGSGQIWVRVTTDGYGSGHIWVSVTTDGSGHIWVSVTTDGYGSGHIWVRAVHKQVFTRVDTRRDRKTATYPVPRGFKFRCSTH